MLIGMILLLLLGYTILELLGGDDALYILPKVCAAMFVISYLLTLILEQGYILDSTCHNL
jgi:hypothetical protein